jgi:hypothetical protein
MMTLVDTDPVGRVQRTQPNPHKKDRLAAIKYGSSPKNRFRPEPAVQQWAPTLMETWALRNNRFIGEALRDVDSDLLLPPHQRPGLVQVGALTLNAVPGGVLVETRKALGEDPLARATLARWLQRRDPQADPNLVLGTKWDAANIAGAHHVTLRDVAGWVEEAGESAVVHELELFAEAVVGCVPGLADKGDNAMDFLFQLGSGPLRDEALARAEYQRLRRHHSDTEIEHYLEIYGYRNPKGTVGRWYHENIRSLRTAD